MDDLFLALFLVSIFALVFGLIKPRLIFRWNGEKLTRFGYRKTVVLLFGSTSILFFVLFGITAKPLSKETDLLNKDLQRQRQTPPQETPATVKTSPLETLAYLDSEGTTAFFIYGIDPQGLDKQFNEAILGGDTDRVIALGDKYFLETPAKTKVQLLEEVSLPPNLPLGRSQIVVYVKIKILDGVHTGKMGWANKEHIKLK